MPSFKSLYCPAVLFPPASFLIAHYCSPSPFLQKPSIVINPFPQNSPCIFLCPFFLMPIRCNLQNIIEFGGFSTQEAAPLLNGNGNRQHPSFEKDARKPASPCGYMMLGTLF